MDYRSFLVHVETDSTSSDARLDLAASLAKRFEATLIGVAGSAVPPLPMADPYGVIIDGEIMAAQEACVHEELKAAEDLFRKNPSCKGLSTEWRPAPERPVEVITREARAADVVIVGRDLERIRRYPYQSADPGDVLMRSGRPLLIVPPGACALEAKRILIGWKDTREACRAVWDALPFLERAERVHVVDIAEERDLDPAARRVHDVVAYLERHHVKAQAEARAQRERSVADELLLVAEQTGADLLVAGGYGHARLREWIFGGVTGDLLMHSPKCCFLSH
ncbi:universal stress protein [Microvirga sp. M2]|uniref:universal stress protein n=1 Tax=Microvirga sp. M2 TaxID=3073270 RepID=UPI0039C2A5D4